jgi:hypothetical protein
MKGDKVTGAAVCPGAYGRTFAKFTDLSVGSSHSVKK